MRVSLLDTEHDAALPDGGLVTLGCSGGDPKAGLGPNPETVSAITLTPVPAPVVAGEVVTLLVEGRTPTGQVAPVSVAWSASGGLIVALSDSEAQFSADTAGTYEVYAQGSEAPFPLDSTTITVVPAVSPTIGVSVAPDFASVGLGAMRQFVATATRQDGSTYAPGVDWIATGGTISSGGLYTAGSTAGSFRVIAKQQGGTLADTSVVSIGGAQGEPVCLAGVAGAYSNQPAGYTRVFEHDFGALPDGSNGAAGTNWLTEYGQNFLSIVSDSTGSGGDANCLRTEFPNGQASGYAPVNISVDMRGDSGRRTEEYFSLWFLIEGSTFENQAVGTKFGFFGYGQSDTGALNQGFLILKGSGRQQLMSSMALEFWQQNTTSRNLARNVGSGNAVTVGVWHHVEILMVLNTVGVANGQFQMWVDGVKTHQYTNVTYRTASASLGFRGWKWHPTWGGLGGTKTRSDFVKFAHAYLSGI